MSQSNQTCERFNGHMVNVMIVESYCADKQLGMSREGLIMLL